MGFLHNETFSLDGSKIAVGTTEGSVSIFNMNLQVFLSSLSSFCPTVCHSCLHTLLNMHLPNLYVDCEGPLYSNLSDR